jgi:Holliday junction resolvase-like predicted endonuclease
MPQTHLRKKLGNLGEKIARQFLLKKSYQLLRENFLIRGGQIDLIMLSPQGNLVFVEVKTRLPSATQITAEESIISAKQIQTLRKTARHFLSGIAFPFTTWQLDLIWINFVQWEHFPPKAKIKHYQNILEI